ncbi:MAG TPA: dihydrolipoamide acetyltransferase family protein [Solirubrobacteraceae bacterium]|nr:dihydrolipoamide acetyltransferase family protein [Solirubrobacteraceae bacterium]
MAEIVMPRLSDTMEEGTILRWLKRDGEHVRRGEELVEIETDKATMTYQSDLDGAVELIAGEGDTLPVGQLIARVGDAAEAGAGTTSETAAPAPSPASDGKPHTDQPSGAPAASAPTEPAPTTGQSGAPPPATAGEPAERVKASPLARRIAHETGVDLHSITGSGPGGRIVKADVQEAGGAAAGGGAAPAGATAGGGGAPAAAAAPSAGVPGPDDVMTAKGQTTTVALSRMQQTIARRMAESKATIPDFTLQSDVDMEECVKLRTELKRMSSMQTPTYNDMVVKACALALREHPHANGSYRDGALQLHSRVNVGVAVAAQDALVVPTVFDTDSKALGEIARETRALAERVRDATITPPELGGGTFTVSNLGMYGIASFAAIINPPQAAILSVGSVARRAVVRDEQLLARHTMALTLVCDHRILYGAGAAEFLARIRELLEAPAALTL